MADDREDGPVVSDSQLLAEVTARKTDALGKLTRKDKAGALAASLSNPPLQAKDNAIKDANAETVEKVLTSFTDAELGPAIESLDMESADNLMKYVYRFMSKNSNQALMLKIHAMLSDKAGAGSIVRAITDRKTV